MLRLDPHPLLDLAAFHAVWPGPLGTLATPAWVDGLVDVEAEVPLAPPDDAHKAAVRDLLRHGGFKPSGRSKPCWEYIRAATAKGKFPRINPAVDLTNLGCLHGCLPVSTVDPSHLHGALRVGIAPRGSRYVFNASGQEIDLGGLICLFDEDGPCANAVKDSQRAKTTDASTQTLTIVWGTGALPDRTRATTDWLIECFANAGARVERVDCAGVSA